MLRFPKSSGTFKGREEFKFEEFKFKLEEFKFGKFKTFGGEEEGRFERRMFGKGGLI